MSAFMVEDRTINYVVLGGPHQLDSDRVKLRESAAIWGKGSTPDGNTLLFL
jgi:hypothetical protein